MALSDSRPNQRQTRVAGCDPASGTGLPRYPRYLPGMLSPLPRWTGAGGSVTVLLRCGLPRILGGSASTTVLSGPSQGSLALRPARLLQPLRLTSVPRASAGGSLQPTVWVATGMNRQFPVRVLHLLASYALVAHQHVVVSSSSLKPLILQQSLNSERLKKFKISKIASRKAGVHISAIYLYSGNAKKNMISEAYHHIFR
jgi:hypothetical protein